MMRYDYILKTSKKNNIQIYLLLLQHTENYKLES